MKNKIIFLVGIIVIPVLIYANEFPICVKDGIQGITKVVWGDSSFLVCWVDYYGGVQQDSSDSYGQGLRKDRIQITGIRRKNKKSLMLTDLKR